jgi:hypothetical protein
MPENFKSKTGTIRIPFSGDRALKRHGEPVRSRRRSRIESSFVAATDLMFLFPASVHRWPGIRIVEEPSLGLSGPRPFISQRFRSMNRSASGVEI